MMGFSAMAFRRHVEDVARIVRRRHRIGVSSVPRPQLERRIMIELADLDTGQARTTAAGAAPLLPQIHQHLYALRDRTAPLLAGLRSALAAQCGPQ